MEYASSEQRFGQWLDHLVEKMRSVAHLHGGVFDKFTGDGALIHFLDKECRLLYGGTSAVDSAIHCAVDLQRAVEIHMKTLRQKLLHYDSQVFGAGIAIDVGHAFWSVDHRDNPVVVGKVVVGACRLADKAPRLSVRLTNWAYRSASDDLRNRLKHIKEVSLNMKESSDDVPLLCWEFMADHDLNVGRGLPAIEELCTRIKKRFEARRGRGEPPIAE
jgi:class 3 adenylate cyclase